MATQPKASFSICLGFDINLIEIGLRGSIVYIPSLVRVLMKSKPLYGGTLQFLEFYDKNLSIFPKLNLFFWTSFHATAPTSGKTVNKNVE